MPRDAAARVCKDELPDFDRCLGDYRLDNVYFDEFNRVDHFPLLTEALLGRGFSPEETTKILGGNFMRVFERVWKP